MNYNRCFIFLIIVSIIIGGILLFIGINNIRSVNSKNYIKTEAIYQRKEIYSSNDDEVTYSLIYSYIVDGKEYEIKTDYGTSIIPKQGSKRVVMYDIQNPKDAILKGGGNDIVIICGLLFIIVPIIIFFGKKSMQGDLSPLQDKIYSVMIGIVLAGFGFAFYYMMCSGAPTLSLC